jgi:predicted MFS family arabinose efflux permease
MTYYIVQASISELLERIYGFDETAVGLCYFDIGFRVVIGGYVNGMAHIFPVHYNL